MPAPFGLGLPTWEYDPEFDLNRHLREVILKHGTEVELRALAGKLFSQVMDRRHPLWDITVVRRLKSNRSGLIFRPHHCLADGIAGVGIMNTLLDTSRRPRRVPVKKAEAAAPVQDTAAMIINAPTLVLAAPNRTPSIG